ncbi:hypothetical protein DW322_18465 [Rhodococcus rhodnii]|nr:hypothetical protein [Rhodococcus rhodnii]TXG91803.1 hypothetical protein DW322_18465 [Rhodococcus rhodnii]
MAERQHDREIRPVPRSLWERMTWPIAFAVVAISAFVLNGVVHAPLWISIVVALVVGAVWLGYMHARDLRAIRRSRRERS